MGALVKNWWMMTVRGLLGMLFGIAILAWPHVSLLTVVVLFGGFAILDGLWAIAAVVRASPRGPTREVWPMAAEGGASLGLGILALVWPFVSYETILIIVGWGLITGVLELALASRAPDRASRWSMATAALRRFGGGAPVPQRRQCQARSVSAGASAAPLDPTCRLETRRRAQCAR